MMRLTDAASLLSSCVVISSCLWPATSEKLRRQFVKPSGACKISARYVLSWATDCIQLSDTYTAAYEEYFGKLKSPLALRFFRRFPLPQDLVGHNVEMLASLLLDLAGGKVGPHKGGNRLIAMRSKAQAILETSGAMRASPRTLALELKAEPIRQLCDELLAPVSWRLGYSTPPEKVTPPGKTAMMGQFEMAPMALMPANPAFGVPGNALTRFPA
jgi:hypothetical protein